MWILNEAPRKKNNPVRYHLFLRNKQRLLQTTLGKSHRYKREKSLRKSCNFP